MRINLDPWQKEFIFTKGDKILNCGRQVGKSVICGIDAGMWALANPNHVILMIAPTERQAYALYLKTLNYIVDEHPKVICKGKDKPTKTKFKLTNGTEIWCLPTGLTGIGVRFLTIGRLYADEASRIPEAVWSAVTPMLLTTGGDTIFLSTPYGKEGMFYDCFINKKGAFKSFTRFSVTSRQVIIDRKICASWTAVQREKALERIEIERARMTMLEFAQEYEGAFLDELRQFFSDELIQSCMTISQVLDGVTSSFFLRDSFHNFLGVDVAEMGEDDCVMLGLRSRQKSVDMISLDVTRKTRLPMTVRSIKTLDSKFNYRKMGIDTGGMGVGVFGPLLEDSQTKRKVVALRNDASFVSEDKKLKCSLKLAMYNNLLWLMETGGINLFNSPELFQSLKSVQAEFVDKKMRIFGRDTHIAEALIRAAWVAKNKPLNIWLEYS